MTEYRVTTTIQKDGFGPRRPEDGPSDLAEFDAGWLAWAVANGVIEVVEGEAPTAPSEPAGSEGPVYREHWHGDPAQAPEGTWEHEWQQAPRDLSPSPAPDKGGEEKGRRRKGSEE